ncbi:short-chain dehydrogenease/reductase-like protein [Aphelenchoides avenae]|nr:short-chain dehydrogenease/reductase-like protein [Aphelenchus avenae]
MGKFDGKVVIVTGSSAGIGRDAAIEFAKEGASVVIHGQSEERLNETKKLISETGVGDDKIAWVLGPLDEEGTPKKIIDAAVSKFGSIHVLVNNAGAVGKPATDPDSLDNYDFLFKVNLRGVVALTQLAMPYLQKNHGNVINVSSCAAIRAYPATMFYCMTKAALDHFTRTAALKYAPNVRVNGINPGPIETYIVQRNNPTPEQVDELRVWWNRNTALGRGGSVSEMSTILKFLASDDASFVTGACWTADGGMSVVTEPFDLKKLYDS